MESVSLNCCQPGLLKLRPCPREWGGGRWGQGRRREGADGPRRGRCRQGREMFPHDPERERGFLPTLLPGQKESGELRCRRTPLLASVFHHRCTAMNPVALKQPPFYYVFYCCELTAQLGSFTAGLTWSRSAVWSDCSCGWRR